ncbi:MAG: DUF881 domain-containing protein [Bacillota bacterium]|uniref:DUF881 domain-containing protein n=1 Tax=Desulforudis sp. DRI-14 TaxID=3459793 RepID=UPI0034938197
MPTSDQSSRTKQVYWGLAIVGLILGLMISTQFRYAREIALNITIQRAQQLTDEIHAATVQRDRLQNRVEELRHKMDQVAANPELSRLRETLDKTKMQAGLITLTGPGVEVTLNDSVVALQPGQDPNLYVLHDEDILRVLNELRAAGAEALAINGERLLATSEVRCVGPTVLVNKTKRLAPPYVITAIGDPNTMVASLKMPGGVLDVLQFWGIQASVKKADLVTVPAYSGATNFQYARPSGEGVNNASD